MSICVTASCEAFALPGQQQLWGCLLFAATSPALLCRCSASSPRGSVSAGRGARQEFFKRPREESSFEEMLGSSPGGVSLEVGGMGRGVPVTCSASSGAPVPALPGARQCSSQEGTGAAAEEGFLLTQCRV